MHLKSLLLLALTLPLFATAQIEKFGSKRDRAPKGWTKFEWPEKRAILFGHFAPTQKEKALIDKALPKTAEPPKSPRKLLIFYRCQYPHASIATANYAFQHLGQKSGAYHATLTDDPATFTDASLAQFDALLLNNTTSFEQTIGKSGQKALLKFVNSGKGLIGIHAASDACKGWKPGQKMLGGRFNGHPWTAPGTWIFKPESPRHPINLPFGNQPFTHRDEVYAYAPGTFSRQRSRVLISLDMSKEENLQGKHFKENQKEKALAQPHPPVSWIHPQKQGRVFYTNFGHNNTTYWHPQILRHYLAGIQYALGDLEADASPQPLPQ